MNTRDPPTLLVQTTKNKLIFDSKPIDYKKYEREKNPYFTQNPLISPTLILQSRSNHKVNFINPHSPKVTICLIFFPIEKGFLNAYIYLVPYL